MGWRASTSWLACAGLRRTCSAGSVSSNSLDEPIRNVGPYLVVVEVADQVMATAKTMVVAASSQPAERGHTHAR